MKIIYVNCGWRNEYESNLCSNEDYLRSRKKRFKSRTGLNFCFRHYFNFATAVVLITGKIAFILCSAIVRRISLSISLRTVKWSDFVHHEELRSAKCDSLCDQKNRRDWSLFISPGKGGGGWEEDFRGSLSFRGNRGGVSRRTQSIKGGL